MTRFKVIAALTAGLLLAGGVQASALEQFKSFVSTTKAAKGDFTQRRILLLLRLHLVGAAAHGENDDRGDVLVSNHAQALVCGPIGHESDTRPHPRARG